MKSAVAVALTFVSVVAFASHSSEVTVSANGELAPILSKRAISVRTDLKPSASRALPVVTPADFVPGREWVWDYFDSTGAIYSTEKYTVISITGSNVLIELASDYSGGQNLKPNHRVLVDIAKCLRAYRIPSAKQAWSIKMFYLSQGRWTEIEQPNTLAFEEKFNCNPREYTQASDPYRTQYSTIRGTPVFQQNPRRKSAGSWFAMGGPQTAVALQKEFSTPGGAPDQTYTFTLRR